VRLLVRLLVLGALIVRKLVVLLLVPLVKEEVLMMRQVEMVDSALLN
jgi:hypothetical protein